VISFFYQIKFLSFGQNDSKVYFINGDYVIHV